MWMWSAGVVCLVAAATASKKRDPQMEILLDIVHKMHYPYCVWLQEKPLESEQALHHAHRIKQLSSHFIMSLTLLNSHKLKRAVETAGGTPPIVSFSQFYLNQTGQADAADVGWSGVHWLLETQPEDLRPFFLPLDSHVWVWNNHQDREVSMRSVYQLRPQMPQVVQEMNADIADSDVVLHRRNLFATPLTILKHLEDPCIFDLECVHYLMWQDFARALNFTTKFVMAQEHLGEYDGKAVAAAFHCLDPQPNILAPTFRGKVNLYIADTAGGKATGDTWAGYSRVFHPHLWLAITLWLLCLALLLSLSNTCRLRNPRPYLPLLCLPINILTNQGDTECCRWWSQDVLIMTGRLLLCVIYQAYAAAIISHLTATTYVYPFTDIEGFRRDGSYALGSLNNSFSVLLITNSGSEAMQDIAKRLLVPARDMPTGFVEGALRMCSNHKFAFLAYNNLMDNLARSICPLRRLPVPVAHALAGIPLPPLSHFKPVLNYILLNYKSSGLINRIERNLSASYEAETSGGGFVPIGLHQLTVPTIILLSGAAFALFFILLEKHRKLKKTSRRN